jgi:hypothetical protein
MPEILKTSLKGLRPKSELLYNNSFLADCDNVYLSDIGIFEAESFTRTFSLDEDAQIFQTRIGIFVATATVIYEYVDSSLDTRFIATTDNGLWSCADFGYYLIFANGVDNVIRTPDGSFNVDNDTIPVANWVCTHRGRLHLAASSDYASRVLEIMGAQLSGLDSDKYIHNNFGIWTKVGELKFQSYKDVDRTNTSGYMPMEYSGKLLRCEPLKNHVIYYGENGISALTLAGNNYAMTTLHTTGIMDSGSVCVNGVHDGITAHYFVDADGYLYVIDATLEMTKLWYQEFMDDTPVRMCYNIRRDEVLINFDNDETFVFSKDGLSKITGDIQDMAELDGTRLVHAPAAITQDDLTITTNIFDMGTTCQKYMWGFTANISATEDVSVVIYYRKERSDSWSSIASTTFDKAKGYHNARRLSAREFYLEFTVEDYTSFQITELMIKYSKIAEGIEE